MVSGPGKAARSRHEGWGRGVTERGRPEIPVTRSPGCGEGSRDVDRARPLVHQPHPAPCSPVHAHVLRFAQDGCRGRAEPLLQSGGHTAGGQVGVQLNKRHVWREKTGQATRAEKEHTGRCSRGSRNRQQWRGATETRLLIGWADTQGPGIGCIVHTPPLLAQISGSPRQAGMSGARDPPPKTLAEPWPRPPCPRLCGLQPHWPGVFWLTGLLGAAVLCFLIHF